MSLFNFFKKRIKIKHFDIVINGEACIDELINTSNKNLYVGKYGFLICKDINIEEGYINGKIQGNVKANKLYIGDL